MNSREKDAQRRKELGDLGEKQAMEALRERGYVVKNINKECKNFPFADLYAEKDRQKLVISVKTRNKYRQGQGKVNEEYNLLYDGKDKYAKQAENEYDAKAYWIAVQVDIEGEKYSIYMGSVEELENKKWKGIRFDREDGKCRAGKPLVENADLPPRFDNLSNQF